MGVEEVEIRVRLPESIYYGLKAFCVKYRMSVDEAVAELLSRALLAEFFGIVLVPKEKLESSKGVAVIDEESLDIELYPRSK